MTCTITMEYHIVPISPLANWAQIVLIKTGKEAKIKFYKTMPTQPYIYSFVTLILTKNI